MAFNSSKADFQCLWIKQLNEFKGYNSVCVAVGLQSGVLLDYGLCFNEDIDSVILLNYTTPLPVLSWSLAWMS